MTTSPCRATTVAGVHEQPHDASGHRRHDRQHAAGAAACPRASARPARQRGRLPRPGPHDEAVDEHRLGAACLVVDCDLVASRRATRRRHPRRRRARTIESPRGPAPPGTGGHRPSPHTCAPRPATSTVTDSPPDFDPHARRLSSRARGRPAAPLRAHLVQSAPGWRHGPESAVTAARGASRAPAAPSRSQRPLRVTVRAGKRCTGPPLQELVQIASCETTPFEVAAGRTPLKERNGRPDAGDLVLLERASHAGNRLAPGLRPRR